MWRSLRYVTASLIAVGVGLVLAGSAPAQGVAINYEFEPKDGAAFEDALNNHLEDRMEEGDPWAWNVWEEIAGTNTGTYIVRSGGHSWADFDSYNENFAGEHSAHFEADVAPTVETTHTWLSQTDTAITRLPEDGSDVRFAEVVRYHIEPGKMSQFNDAIERVHDAVAASDYPVYYNFINPVMGTKGPQKVGAFFYEDFADMQQPETPLMEMMSSQMGEKKAEKIFDQIDDAIRHTESSLFVHRENLSIQPAEGEDGGQ